MKNNLIEFFYLKKMKEMKIINGFVKYFLPNYGPAIENLILYGSLTINDNTVRRNTHDMNKSWDIQVFDLF